MKTFRQAILVLAIFTIEKTHSHVHLGLHDHHGHPRGDLTVGIPLVVGGKSGSYSGSGSYSQSSASSFASANSGSYSFNGNGGSSLAEIGAAGVNGAIAGAGALASAIAPAFGIGGMKYGGNSGHLSGSLSGNNQHSNAVAGTGAGAVSGSFAGASGDSQHSYGQAAIGTHGIGVGWNSNKNDGSYYPNQEKEGSQSATLGGSGAFANSGSYSGSGGISGGNTAVHPASNKDGNTYQSTFSIGVGTNDKKENDFSQQTTIHNFNNDKVSSPVSPSSPGSDFGLYLGTPVVHKEKPSSGAFGSSGTTSIAGAHSTTGSSGTSGTYNGGIGIISSVQKPLKPTFVVMEIHKDSPAPGSHTTVAHTDQNTIGVSLMGSTHNTGSTSGVNYNYGGYNSMSNTNLNDKNNNLDGSGISFSISGTHGSNGGSTGTDNNFGTVHKPTQDKKPERYEGSFGGAPGVISATVPGTNYGQMTIGTTTILGTSGNKGEHSTSPGTSIHVSGSPQTVDHKPIHNGGTNVDISFGTSCTTKQCTPSTQHHGPTTTGSLSGTNSNSFSGTGQYGGSSNVAFGIHSDTNNKPSISSGIHSKPTTFGGAPGVVTATGPASNIGPGISVTTTHVENHSKPTSFGGAPGVVTATGPASNIESGISVSATHVGSHLKPSFGGAPGVISATGPATNPGSVSSTGIYADSGSYTKPSHNQIHISGTIDKNDKKPGYYDGSFGGAPGVITATGPASNHGMTIVGVSLSKPGSMGLHVGTNKPSHHGNAVGSLSGSTASAAAGSTASSGTIITPGFLYKPEVINFRDKPGYYGGPFGGAPGIITATGPAPNYPSIVISGSVSNAGSHSSAANHNLHGSSHQLTIDADGPYGNANGAYKPASGISTYGPALTGANIGVIGGAGSHAGSASQSTSGSYAGSATLSGASTHGGSTSHIGVGANNGANSLAGASLHGGVGSYGGSASHSGAVSHSGAASHNGAASLGGGSLMLGLGSLGGSGSHNGAGSNVGTASLTGTGLHGGLGSYGGSASHSGAGSYSGSASFSGAGSHGGKSSYEGINSYGEPASHIGLEAASLDGVGAYGGLGSYGGAAAISGASSAAHSGAGSYGGSHQHGVKGGSLLGDVVGGGLSFGFGGATASAQSSSSSSAHASAGYGARNHRSHSLVFKF